MTVLEIPLSPTPQRFFASMAGVTRRLTFRWNVPASVWIMDISDQNDVPILAGVPLITGADLLGQYGYLGLGGMLIAQTNSDPGMPPGRLNLGQDGKLYFVVPDA